MSTTMIDGFNLSLTRGTGISTYSRNLSYALSGLGSGVSVIYGGARPPAKTPLMREVSFFDDLDRPHAPWVRAMNMAWSTALKGGVHRAEPVPLTGKVETRMFADRLPTFETLYNL